MTFFYDLNKKLATIADQPQTRQLNERDMSRAKHDKYKKSDSKKVEEDFGTTAAIAGGAALGSALGAVKGRYDDLKQREKGATAYTPADQRDKPRTTMQRIRAAAGIPSKKDPNVKGMAEEYGPLESAGGEPMTPKQKSFAKLAPPEDKITFADKIAGAKKEVDEMLGDVAAEAMKGALKGGQKKLDRNHNGRLDAQDFAMLRAGKGKQETDETRNRDLEDWYGINEPKSDKGQVHRGTYGTEYQGEPDEDDDIGQKKLKKAKSAAPSGEKRGPGRPTVGAGKGKKIGARGPGAKKVTKEGGDNISDDVRQAMAVLKKAGYKISKGEEKLDEKPVSRNQAIAARIGRGIQKGEVTAKKGTASAEMAKMEPKELKKFAKTDTKGLPKKVKAKEEVEETTVSGSVATAPEAPKAKSKGGVQFGKGIYDSMNRELEAMIAESMNISMNMSNSPDGGPSKSLTVTATDEDAVYLGRLLKMAGVGGGEGSCGCGQQPCACNSAEQVDENQPEWPTDEVAAKDNITGYDTDGINGRKTTIAGDGQTTVPVTAVQVREDEQQGVAEGSNKMDSVGPRARAKTQMIKMYGDGEITFTKTSNGGYFIQHEDDFGDTNSHQYDPQTGKVDFSGVTRSSYYGEGVAEGSLDEQEQVMAPESQESELDEEIKRMREMAGIGEAAKPDFLDVDNDGNKKEKMKDAAADAESDKKVEESILDMTRLWKAYKG